MGVFKQVLFVKSLVALLTLPIFQWETFRIHSPIPHLLNYQKKKSVNAIYVAEVCPSSMVLTV